MLSTASTQTDFVTAIAECNDEKVVEEAVEPSTSTAQAKPNNNNAVAQPSNTSNSIAPQNSVSSFYDSALLTPQDFSSVEDVAELYNVDEPRYCFCNQVSYGTMIGCDNKKCPYEWFHFACVGITRAPKGKWYCPVCKASMRNSGTRKRKLSD